MKNYVNYTPKLILWVVILLLGGSFVPCFEYEGFSFGRINILSSLVDDSFFDLGFESDGDPRLDSQLESPLDSVLIAQVVDTVVVVEPLVEQPLPETDSIVEVVSSPVQPQDTATPTVNKPTQTPPPVNLKDKIDNKSSDGLILMENYSDDPDYLAGLKAQLSSGSATRIAIMGDSYLEGDIIAMDIRAALQSRYGGGGVGFMPITAVTPLFRRTIRHSFSDNWTTKSIVTSPSNGDYLLSGSCFYPDEGAWVQYQTVKSDSPRLSRYQKATLLFQNMGNSQIEVIVNGGAPQIYRPESGDQIQRIVTLDTLIKSIKYRFSECQGLEVYGTLLDHSQGVSLDNYYLRGNKGTAMVHVDVDKSRQYNLLAPYSLIVLEYGLNVSTDQDPGVLSGYVRSMCDVVSHLRLCYPDVPVVVMGVGDRLSRESGSLCSMPSVLILDRLQRDLARRMGVVYWSTRDAIVSRGGLERFVENGWAAKDYTHLSVRGGAQIADSFVESLYRLME